MPTCRHLRLPAALVVAAVLAGCSTLKPPAPAAPPPPATEAARELPPPVVRIDPAPPERPELVPPAPEAAPEETGIASWYGRAFQGRRTANGERYDMHAFTAAHRTLPFDSLVRVRNPANGREVVVRINDRGPYKRGRIVDLSRAAAQALGIAGIAPVELQLLRGDEARLSADDPR